VERGVLVLLDVALSSMEVLNRVLGEIVVVVVVLIDGLRLEPCNGVKLLDLRSPKTSQRTEDSALDLGHLGIFHCVHQGVLGLGRMALQLHARVFPAKRRDLRDVWGTCSGRTFWRCGLRHC